MAYYLLIAAVLVFLIVLKVAKFIGTVVLLALIVIAITMKKKDRK